VSLHSPVVHGGVRLPIATEKGVLTSLIPVAKAGLVYKPVETGC